MPNSIRTITEGEKDMMQTPAINLPITMTVRNVCHPDSDRDPGDRRDDSGRRPSRAIYSGR